MYRFLSDLGDALLWMLLQGIQWAIMLFAGLVFINIVILGN